MSRVDEPLTDGAIAVAADLTLRQHEGQGVPYAPGTCRQCTADGCPQLDWAIEARRTALAAQPVSPVPLLLAAANAPIG